MQKPSINLNGWQTIQDYAKAKGHSTQFVYKLIKLGKLEAVEVPDLNGLKLVKEA